MSKPDLLELSEKLAAAAEFQDTLDAQTAAAEAGGPQAVPGLGLAAGMIPWNLIWGFVEKAVDAYLQQHGLKPPA